MKICFSDRVLLVFVSSLFLQSTNMVAQQPVSHVRVVRLSYVSGTAAVKQTGAGEWAKALVNTPIREGFEISTSSGSYAEVQFENGSTARLGELSRLVFDQLALDAEGDKLNHMRFEQGYATFHFLPEKHDAYNIKIADATLTPSGKSLFRADLEKSHVRVEVFNGSVQVVGPSGSAKLSKDKILDYNTGATEVAFNTRQGITKDSWDKWADARDSQESLALSDQAVAAHGPVYGWGDLDAYGEWAMFPGFGYGWMPFAPRGWAPYSMGMWGWYPGMGYTWISGEPWGWLPYHYGAWNYSAEFGYFWMPGDFGFWSPALVSWYMGPGWAGWAPLGLASPRGLSKPVTTISATAIQTGQFITPQTVSHVGLSEGTLTAHLPFEPGAGALLAGTPLGAGAATSFTAHTGGVHTLAPSSILMGGEPDKESELLGGGRRLREPLRVRLGTTLGGQYKVGGTVGEFRGEAFDGVGRFGETDPSQPSPYSRGNGKTTLNVLPHGRSAESPGVLGGPTSNAGSGSGSSHSAPASVNASSSSHSAGSSTSGGHH